jgi:CRISPR-associated exonuclease Cas4
MDAELAPEPLVTLSAIEHYAYCPRQCALIYVEQVYEDNVYTTRGQIAHERVHGADDALTRSADGVEIRRGLPLYSDRLGLIGRADLVEMRSTGPYPVEYKSGRIHRTPAELQLCAQALCLEEMYGLPTPRGAIYRAAARTRREVEFTATLRQRTLEVLAGVRKLLLRGQTPPPAANHRLCPRCSLRELCLPDVVRESARLRGIQSALFRVYDGEEPEED